MQFLKIRGQAAVGRGERGRGGGLHCGIVWITRGYARFSRFFAYILNKISRGQQKLSTIYAQKRTYERVFAFFRQIRSVCSDKVKKIYQQ